MVGTDELAGLGGERMGVGDLGLSEQGGVGPWAGFAGDEAYAPLVVAVIEAVNVCLDAGGGDEDGVGRGVPERILERGVGIEGDFVEGVFGDGGGLGEGGWEGGNGRRAGDCDSE